MKTKIIGFIAVLAIAGVIWLATVKPGSSPSAANESSMSSGAAAATTPAGSNQVFEVSVNEGYSPREIAAKAGVPVVLKMKTQAAFDCSTAFNIPQLGIRVHLPPTGETAITIPAQKAGDSIYGVCGMGMYSLVIKFS
jgi:plastocyanin domain-containing protein